MDKGSVAPPRTIPVTNDDRLQIDPQIAYDSNENIVCVFVQLNSSISENTSVMDVFNASEIAYCVFNKNSGSWGNIDTITSNN